LNDGSGKFVFQRSPDGNIIFLASWHHSNMRMAAQLLSRFQGEVSNVHWDINVDGKLKDNRWHKNYYRTSPGGKLRYSLHESFQENQIIGLNCLVPNAISDEEFWRLMSKAGQYKGLSPWKPGENGFYDVVSIRPRRAAPIEEEVEELEEYPPPPHRDHT
jgi:hypothetical protein